VRRTPAPRLTEVPGGPRRTGRRVLQRRRLALISAQHQAPTRDGEGGLLVRRTPAPRLTEVPGGPRRTGRRVLQRRRLALISAQHQAPTGDGEGGLLVRRTPAPRLIEVPGGPRPPTPFAQPEATRARCRGAIAQRARRVLFERALPRGQHALEQSVREHRSRAPRGDPLAGTKGREMQARAAEMSAGVTVFKTLCVPARRGGEVSRAAGQSESVSARMQTSSVRARTTR
jgi:hypothetical protein